MSYLQGLGHRAGTLLLAAVYWLSQGTYAWAQESSPTVGGRGASPWVLPYALVILGVGLGLLILCKPSKRREKAKVEQ